MRHITIAITRYCVFSLVLLLWLATSSVISENSVQAKERKYRLVVSFYSIGSGIDGKAKEKFDEFISDYEKTKHIRLARETVQWGMEGETDYCFKLSGLPSKERDRLVSEIKTLLKGSTLIRIEENAPCKNKRKN